MNLKPEVTASEASSRNLYRPSGVLILAGGKSSRMGFDKASAQFDGTTLLQRAVNYWHSVLPRVPVYIASGRPEHFSSLPDGTAAIYDLLPGNGPMSGIHAAFRTTELSSFAVSAVDMPLLSKDLFTQLVQACDPRYDLCIFSQDGHLEPLYGFYQRSVLPLLEQMISEQNFRMMQLVKRADSQILQISRSNALQNTNTPDELSDAAGILKKEQEAASR